MSFAFFKGEKSIGELVTRLYREVFPSQAAHQQASDALIQANPQLADLSKVPPGSKIVVPVTPALEVNTAEVTVAARTATPSAAQLSQQLDAMKTSVPAAASAAVARANATLALAQTPEVQAAAQNDPVLAQRLATINQQAAASIQSAQNLQAEFLKAVGPAQARLTRYSKA
jgi:hypothetical protein